MRKKYKMDDIPQIAKVLRQELEANYLEVVLIPAKEPRHSGHQIRATQSQNAEWYKEFWSRHGRGPSSNGRYNKFRSLINRNRTIEALRRMEGGDLSGVYAERIIDLIQTTDFYERLTGEESLDDSFEVCEYCNELIEEIDYKLGNHTRCFIALEKINKQEIKNNERTKLS